MIEWLIRGLAVLATLMTTFLLYLIIFHTPTSMRNYKKIIIFMMLSVYQLDISNGLLILLTPISGSFGCQLKGLLGALFPSLSQYLVLFTVFSFSLGTSSIAIGFVYREYALTSEKPRAKIIQILELLVALILGLSHLVAHYLSQTDYSTTLEYLKNNSISYDHDAGIYVITAEKAPLLKLASIVGVCFAIVLGIIVIKSIITVNILLNGTMENISVNTIRLQKMLMRAMIWQALVPLVLLGIPKFLLALITLCDPNGYYAELGEALTAVFFSTPSFYSPAHNLCVIVFTTPYKNCVMNMIRRKERQTMRITPTSAEFPVN